MTSITRKAELQATMQNKIANNADPANHLHSMKPMGRYAGNVTD